MPGARLPLQCGGAFSPVSAVNVFFAEFDGVSVTQMMVKDTAGNRQPWAEAPRTTETTLRTETTLPAYSDPDLAEEVLGREPRPVRFVNSLNLGEEPSIEHVRRRIARSPGVRFKIDAQSTWTPELIEAVAATLNGRPRKILDWRTPAEALDEHLRSLQQAGVATTD